jgi:asparagine synthase (glutamine-hydrolysing)
MFAIAILDKNINTLLLYRDRLGVKPLYIYSQNDLFMFSSEIKSFLSHEKFDKRINYQSIHNYFIFNYIPVPDTIFENVRHILPGHYLKVDLNNTSCVEHYKYWEIENSVEDYLVSDDEYITEIDKLLLDATKIRMRSDVSVGAFLSGGLDSSLISAYMHKITKSSFQTFTIGFNEKEFDESKYAKYITDKYGLGSNIKILEADIVKLWSRTTWHNDQPHGDISFIPTYIVSEFASKTHKLVLTGDGGDELFAGYSKYLNLDKVEVKSKEYFDSISLFKENGIINELYTDDFKNKVSLKGAFSLFSKTISNASNKDNVNQALYFDTLQLLPGNNLVKPDKMGMANSLEARSPFLDYRFFEILMKIPGNKKLKNGETKYILKKLALRHFSEEHVYRDKQMFTVPIGEWFKTKLSNFLVETLTDKRFVSRNIFKQELILLMINDHITGKKNLTRELRAIVNLELWFREFID